MSNRYVVKFISQIHALNFTTVFLYFYCGILLLTPFIVIVRPVQKFPTTATKFATATCETYGP